VSGFVGRFEHSLDDKGRIVLPVRFRPEFLDGTTLTQHFEGCLALWPPAEFARQLRAMQELYREGTTDARNKARVWSQGASTVDVDRQGRLVVPQSARIFAALDAEVLVIGALDHLELWSPERFNERVAPAEDFFNGSDLDQ
jgi:MraZ protein